METGRERPGTKICSDREIPMETVAEFPILVDPKCDISSLHICEDACGCFRPALTLGPLPPRGFRTQRIQQ